MIERSGNGERESGAAAADRLASIKARIARAAQKAGRNPADITLVAVSKTFPVSDIRHVLNAGQSVFGENRVQEAQGKWPELQQAHEAIELHLIGPLQTNKLAQALDLFDVIQTLDRERLAAALAAARQKGAVLPRLFIQVNTGEEPQKAGLSPASADEFIARCRDIHGLVIEGLMCIPPFDEEPARHFAMLRRIAERNNLMKLSCGMSADFESAIANGATHVRVGSALFGTRL